MARAVIGRLPAVYTPPGGWQVAPENRFQLRSPTEALNRLARGQPCAVLVTVERMRRPRTNRQNRMMWALLAVMADHLNGGRSGGVTPEDCYIEMLEQYGSGFDYLEVPVGALDILRGCYRIVKVVELLDGKRCTVKCGMGSSAFDTHQMKDLIDGIFDRLAEMGVNDPEVTEYWREWKQDDLP